ncbi:MAG: hypothetical protein ACI8QZ_003163 [Chlamydiales bacterium]|jgi:hypothetical protein
MRSIILVVLALLVLAVLGGVGFMFLGGDDASLASGVSGPDEIPAAPEHAPAEMEPVPDRPIDTPPAAAKPSPKKDARAAETQAASARAAAAAPAPETAYQQQYADQSLQELNRTARKLYAEHRSAIQQLMETRYANAFYESYPYEYDVDGERLDPSDVIPAPPAGEHRIRQIFEDPEVDEWRLVELPPSEYPDLYSGYAEWKWVSDEAQQRAGGAADDTN